MAKHEAKVLMGIRVHKILGFGLDDVSTNEATGAINDKRFNYEVDPWFDSVDIRSFYEWWLDNEENKQDRFYAELYLKDLNQGHIDTTIKRFGFYENEGGLPNVLAFIAPSVAFKWFRYDDDIDYYEARPNMEATVQIINRTIYPWDTYWDITTIPPKKLDGLQFQTYVHFKQLLDDDMLEGRPDRVDEFSAMLMEQGIDVSMVRPSIPPEIVALVKYMKIFREEKDIYSMKPMIYTYWS